jgi:hypothetical protein
MTPEFVQCYMGIRGNYLKGGTPFEDASLLKFHATFSGRFYDNNPYPPPQSQDK